MPSTLTTTQHRKFSEYLRALFANGTSDEILRRLSEVEIPSPYKARIKVVYSEPSPLDAVRQLEQKSRSVYVTSPEATTFSIRPLESSRKPEIVYFFVTPFTELDPRVQAVISISTTPQWRTVTRHLRCAYPRLVPILLSQAELINAARSLRQHTDHDVRVRSFTAREDVKAPDGITRRSVREWTDEELDGALLHVRDRMQVITSLDLEFYPRFGGAAHIVPKATCKIRKYGEVEVTGSLDLAFSTVATEVAQVGLRKLIFYSGRGLREAAYKPHPLAINYAKPLFEDLQLVRSLVQTLAKYPRSMHAVQHGNPYAHVRLTDLLDFSSFDVWALPPSRLVLLPGLKASEAAFERLVHYIFDSFREGEVTNYERGQEVAPVPGSL